MRLLFKTNSSKIKDKSVYLKNKKGHPAIFVRWRAGRRWKVKM